MPVTRPVSGIAMGLIKEADGVAVLSDILGDEDHLGDMDFKVAGTEKGLTSLQMDIKIAGITKEIMHTALEQAKGGRMHILGEMGNALDKESINKALKMIKEIVAEPEIGEIYEGKVVGLKDFGIFVNFFGPKDGLVHVSQMANERVNHPKDLVKEGDTVWVKLMVVLRRPFQNNSPIIQNSPIVGGIVSNPIQAPACGASTAINTLAT